MANSFSIYTSQSFTAAPSSALYQNPILVNLSTFASSTGYFSPSFIVTTGGSTLGTNAIANFRYIFSNNGSYNPATSASIFAGASSITVALPSSTSTSVVINPSNIVSIGAAYMYVWLDLFNVNSSFTLTATGYTASVTAPVNTNQNTVVLNPTVTAGTYAANKVIGSSTGSAGGSGIFTLNNLNGNILNSIILNFSSTSVNQGFVVGLFSANPSSSTFTDDVAAAINSTDLGKLIGYINITNYSSVFGTHTSYVASGLNLDVGNGQTIYAVILCSGSSVMAATSTFVNAIFNFV